MPVVAVEDEDEVVGNVEVETLMPVSIGVVIDKGVVEVVEVVSELVGVGTTVLELMSELVLALVVEIDSMLVVVELKNGDDVVTDVEVESILVVEEDDVMLVVEDDDVRLVVTFEKIEDAVVEELGLELRGDVEEVVEAKLAVEDGPTLVVELERVEGALRERVVEAEFDATVVLAVVGDVVEEEEVVEPAELEDGT